MRLLPTWLLSFAAQMRASAAIGRASRHQSKGKLREALAEGQLGLALLRPTYIDRTKLAGASLATLVILVEGIAERLAVVGASADDLRDSIAFLKSISDDPNPRLASSLAAIPWLEMRHRLKSQAA